MRPPFKLASENASAVFSRVLAHTAKKLPSHEANGTEKKTRIRDGTVRQQRNIVAALGLLILCLALFSVISRVWGPFLYLNTTPSVPEGVYYVTRVLVWQKGTVVLFRLPEELDGFARGSSWLKPGGVLIKRVGALPGDEVCVADEIFINDVSAGEVSKTDRDGRELPRISGCFGIPEGYFLPIGDGSPRSFDGRYFGAVKMADAVGEGVRLCAVSS
ncbi:MAG TPA: S26 family signal peptidase [Oligoflexia bacterium]|nr:S26 family signal peptidase [Oligoflexia bacterium]